LLPISEEIEDHSDKKVIMTYLKRSTDARLVS
jgi:hypothetical protein